MMRAIIALVFIVSSMPIHADFVQSKAHGFHWYSQEHEEKLKRIPAPTNAVPTPKPSPYERLLEIRKQTLNKLSEALIEPSFDATVEYMKAQQVYAKHNQAFVRYWQEALLTHPELDNTLNFPTDNSAIASRNQSMNALMARVIEEGAHKYGLIFFYRGTSLVSQKMAANLLPFVNVTHFSMISVTTDGKVIAGLPSPKNIPLKAIQKTMVLEERYMPALFLVNLETQRMSPLSYGFVSTTELKERFLDVATNFKRFSYEGLGE